MDAPDRVGDVRHHPCDRACCVSVPWHDATQPCRHHTRQIWRISPEDQSDTKRGRSIVRNERSGRTNSGPRGPRPAFFALRCAGGGGSGPRDAQAVVGTARGGGVLSRNDLWRPLRPAPGDQAAGGGGSGRRTGSSHRFL